MVDLKKFLPGKGEDNGREYFWSLVIEPGWVQAGIWRIENDVAQVVLSSPPSAWESDEELIQASDSCLSSAIQGFPEEEAEPQKTVFGVSSSWVTEGEIKKEYLDKIKNLCSELSLTPIGFVVLPEAVAHLVKSEEGSPLNAVVLGVYGENLELSVFRLGNLSGTTSVARSVSLSDDVTEGLTRFAKSGNVPSRFILYNGKEGELEEARQALLKVNWEEYKDLKFLHTPKIEIVDSKTKVHAVCLAGAAELASVKSLEVVSEVSEDEEVTAETEVWTQPSGQRAEEFQSADKLGFVMDKDIKKVTPEKETKDEIDKVHQNVEPVSESFERPRPKINTERLSGAVSNFGRTLKSYLGFLGGLGKLFGGSGRKPLISGGIFLAALLLIGFLLWWFYPKAVITLYVSPQRLEENVDVTIEAGRGSSDFEERVLAGQILKTSLDGDRTKDTTGTKTVGDRATGEVTLYRVGPQLNLPAGTTLNGPSDLQFTLDNPVTVASGSAGTPGTTNASVTAADIGAQYNLAGGATFSVSNYSTADVEAKNENAFSGGTSREISAVSEEDREVLQDELVDELTERAISELKGDLSNEEVFIEKSLTATASSTTFSHRVGDETETLRLNLSIDAEAVTIERSELIELAQNALTDRVPEGFVLRDEQIGFEFDLENVNGGEYEFRVRVSANLLPEINTDAVADMIKGKYPNVANEYLLREVPGFVRAEVRFRPKKLPGRLGTLPRVAGNIEVEVAAER